METGIRSWAKAELHVHLEGSIDEDTLAEICPAVTREEIAAHYRHESFLDFLRNYVWVVKKLERPEHYALALRRMAERLDAERVSYAEVNLSVGVILWRQQNFEEIFAALEEERRRAGMEIYWIFDAVRQFGVGPSQQVLELAAANQERGVVGFGLGGDEARGPASWFRELCAQARREGLHVALHAGESEGPRSVWEAIEAGSERIGHGIRAIEDPVLVEHLRAHGIPLEICVSSNVATGVVASLREHPVKKLFDAGAPVTLNTDDPPMFQTTLSREYELARQEFGFTEDELRKVRDNAYRYAFRKPRVTPADYAGEAGGRQLGD